MSAMFALLLAQAAAVAPATASPTPFKKTDDAKILCRMVSPTGTRVGSERVCLPKREWQRMWDESRSTTSSMQDHQSKTRPPGQ